jgi:hypothetical protein
MAHLIIHYDKYGNLSNMYQCNEFKPQKYLSSKIYKNVNSTFYHSIKEMNLSEIKDYTKLPTSLIIYDNI